MGVIKFLEEYKEAVIQVEEEKKKLDAMKEQQFGKR